MLENTRTAALLATPVSSGKKTLGASHSGVRGAELVWSLFIYPGFNLNNMFETRPVMLLSNVALW